MQSPGLCAAPRCCQALEIPRCILHDTGTFAEADRSLLLVGMEDGGVLQLQLHLGGSADGDVRSADEASRVRGQEQDRPCKASASVSPPWPARLLLPSQK